MKDGAFGTSQKIINTVLPRLVRRAVEAAKEHSRANGIFLVDVFAALGGQEVGIVPPGGLTQEFASAHQDLAYPCIYMCDSTWNDQLHPCDRGFTAIAQAVHDAITSWQASINN